MTMLFEPDRHVPVCDTAWDASFAHETLRAIVRDIEASRVAAGQWPVHPLDEEGDVPKGGFKSLYLGSAGVLWALWLLQREGAVVLATDPAQEIDAVAAAYLSDPDTGEVVPSYLLGQVGIQLVQWRLTGSAAVADALHAAVRSNIANPTNEALWAAPGTMVAAWHLWEATGEPRWRELFLDNVEQVWRTWQFDDKAQCHLWTQDMFGRVVQYLGAGHGFAGNVYALLKGAAVLDDDRRRLLYERCLATLQAKVVFEDGAANWPVATAEPSPGRPRFLMQWCHGAPGFVTSLADFPVQHSPDLEAMLVAAGEAVWRAGPLAKGYGLCHGTAGNGYAFLKLHRRTGDARWLERARAFAMHAIAQREAMQQQHGQGRYTLWTGDPGLAMYLWHCLQGQDGMPGLDTLQ